MSAPTVRIVKTDERPKLCFLGFEKENNFRLFIFENLDNKNQNQSLNINLTIIESKKKKKLPFKKPACHLKISSLVYFVFARRNVISSF